MEVAESCFMAGSQGRALQSEGGSPRRRTQHVQMPWGKSVSGAFKLMSQAGLLNGSWVGAGQQTDRTRNGRLELAGE